MKEIFHYSSTTLKDMVTTIHVRNNCYKEKKRNTIVDKFWKTITRLKQEGGGCMGKVKDDKRMY